MLQTLVTRLPGVVFQTVPPDLGESLPPMDIAAFVGFAASGPLHTPVVIEDFAQFREIFGADLPLAWDPEPGEMQYALLAPAVRDFFRNGGRRCWIVRVGNPVAPSAFLLPFMLGVVEGEFAGAWAEARSQGTWADDLQLNTTLQTTLLPTAKFTKHENEYRLELSGGTRENVQAGDLLAVDFIASPMSSPIRLFLPVAEVVAPDIRRGQLQNAARVFARTPAQQGHWFKIVPALPAPVSSLTARALGRDSAPPLPLVDLELLSSPPLDEEQVQLAVSLPLESAPTPGSLLELKHGAAFYLFPIITRAPREGSETSPPASGVTILTAPYLMQKLSPAEGEAESQGQAHTIAQLSFEIQVSRLGQLSNRLADLAFVARHERYWGHLSTDEKLLARPKEGVPRKEGKAPGSALRTEIIMPRFPFAFPVVHEEKTNLFLPIGMPFQTNDEARQGTIGSFTPETALRRNGLEKFSAGLFLDEDLCEKTLAAIADEVFHKRYIRDEQLTGIHAIHDIEEITMLAVPDAGHRGWIKSEVAAKIFAAPKLSISVSAETAHLSWGTVPEATSYEWQQAAMPDFSVALTFEVGAATHAEAYLPTACPREFWFRVRAVFNNEKGPWSNTERTLFPPETFVSCEAVVQSAPAWEQFAPAGDELVLQWQAVAGATTYELERAPLPTFDGAIVILNQEVLHHREFRPSNQVLWYRVRAWFGEAPGPWSVTQVIGAATRADYVIVATVDYRDDDLLAVQRALLRFCGSRGDLFTVLSLPSHYREEKALLHQAKLIPDGRNGINSLSSPSACAVPPLSLGEIRAASYAALYHPWLVDRDENVSLGGGRVGLRRTPPEGAVCGQMARRSRVRGAWIASANEALAGVVSLAPVLQAEHELELFAAQINLLRQDVRGFLALSSHTLSPETEWRQINVRRLMILLRRVALRVGDRSVFQPHDASFRRLMQRLFERVLNDLFQRGAFAGAHPEEAYQVVADESINTPQSVDAGRFIIELRVAPSLPMMFITVRLVQTSAGALVEE